jgi:glycolate oxidase FAD binding subunit
LDTLKVRDAQDVEDAVRGAIASEQPLEIIGHGSKRLIGQPMTTNAVLDLSALNSVISYEPNELIVTAQAGAPLSDVMSLIDSKNQAFGFEPIDTSVLLGTPAGLGTIGGMLGTGLAGPRRIKAGSVRDHLLGAKSVSGFGDSYVTGGKVVKNVTGYDLCKLLTGSWGTLSVVTEVTFKVMPKAESETTVVLHGLDDPSACRAMNRALGSPFDVSAAAHVPAMSLDAGGDSLTRIGAGHQAITLIRLEGFPASVADRARSLTALLADFGAADVVTGDQSNAAWAAIRDVVPLAAKGPFGDRPVWRIVCPPADGGVFGESLERQAGAEVIYDWGGGLIWAALPPAPDAHAAWLRQRLQPIGGHATLIRAADDIRAAVDVFQPLAPGVAALNKRIKKSFDPRDILNRGRMVRAHA